ncbi:hypothetical protein [Paenibacillus sp. SI8]|uniref:hypothetical protein n=1 Tax=unclassified Paenibacillus TaxID=185978 RepID=UPI003464FB0F
MHLKPLFLLAVFVLCLVTGCSEEPEKEPTATITPSATPTMTLTPKQTNTDVVTATPVPQIETTPSDSPTPKATHTAAPTAAPIPVKSTPAVNQVHKQRLDSILYYNNGESFWAFGQGAVFFSDNNGKQWRDMTPSGVRLTAAGYGGNVFAFRQTSSQIDVYEHSVDPEGEWKQSVLPTQEKWELTGDLLFATHMVSEDRWLLITSASKKSLYRISSNAHQWTRVGEITDQVICEPSGAAIVTNKKGWITCSEGTDDILLYRTTDGGVHWTKEKLATPSDVSQGAYTANVYSPVFDEENDSTWTLPVEIIQGSEQEMVYYTTFDAGTTWALSQNSHRNVKHASAYYLDPTFRRGTAISVKGDKLYRFTMEAYSKTFGGPVPPPAEIKLTSNLSKATARFFRTSWGDDGKEQYRGWALLDGELVIAQANGTVWQKP